MALPEELTPLAEALEQAQQRVDQVTALREALEIKVSPTLLQSTVCKACVALGGQIPSGLLSLVKRLLWFDLLNLGTLLSSLGRLLQAQEVAQLAIYAKDEQALAAKALSGGKDELEATEIVQKKLLEEIEELVKLKAAQRGGESISEQSNVLDTIDLKDSSPGNVAADTFHSELLS